MNTTDNDKKAADLVKKTEIWPDKIQFENYLNDSPSYSF